MVSLVVDKQRELESACQRFGVRRLEVFGSAATGEQFDPGRSDVDFLVEFLPDQELGPWLRHFFEFQHALEDILERSVDLVMPSALRNTHFIREVDRTRRTIYAA